MNVTITTTRETQRTSTVDATVPTPQDGSDTGPAGLLPEPDACGLCDGSMAELSMLLTRADEQDRVASRRIETTADQAATREENDRVAQLQAKAGDDESQALASGIAGIAGGALAVVGSFVSSPAASNPPGASDAAHPTDWHQVLGGLSGVAPSVGGLIASQYKAASDRADADGARSEAQAQADLRRYNQAHEDTQATNQSMQKVEQFLDQVQQTENATRLTAATFRA